jgi:hypothetical protein
MDQTLKLFRGAAIITLYLCFFTFPIFYANRVYYCVRSENLEKHIALKPLLKENLFLQEPEVTDCSLIDLIKNFDELFIKAFIAVFLSLLISFRKTMKIGTL